MFKNELFNDRKEAGKKLAAKLKRFSNKEAIVLAIPRGGVVVGYEIAKEIHASLDILVPVQAQQPH